MIANYHIPTCYSDDSVFEMEDVVNTAISKGLDEIYFTDSIELHS